MESLRSLDHDTLEWFRSFWGNSRLDFVMVDVSALGGRYVLSLVVLFAVGLLLSLRRRRTAGFVTAAAVGGALLSWFAKELIGRDRPSPHHPLLVLAAPGHSFPSGHSMLSAIIYLTLALVATAIIPRWRVRVYVVGTSLLLVALIGISRLYLGVHYLTDVVAGWVAGLVWALLCRWLEYHWVLRAERRAAAEDG